MAIWTETIIEICKRPKLCAKILSTYRNETLKTLALDIKGSFEGISPEVVSEFLKLPVLTVTSLVQISKRMSSKGINDLTLEEIRDLINESSIAKVLDL